MKCCPLFYHKETTGGVLMAQKKTEERKHLFGTTEKSDFILNMTREGTHKLCGLYSIIAIAVLLVANIPYTIAKHTFDNYDQDNVRHYADDLLADYISIFVIGMGLIGFWFFLVGRMKKEVVIKDNKALLLPVFIIAVSAWSMFASGDISVGFLGYLDRSEGLLTILAYWGFFAAGMVVTSDKWRIKLTDFLVAVGLFNAVVAIAQTIPGLYSIMPNKFKDLFIRMGNRLEEGQFLTEEGIFEKGQAATGFMITPHALAAVMTIIFAVAAAGFAFEKSGKKKVFYGVSAAACSVAAICSKTITGIIGVGTAAAAVLVIAIVKSVKDKKKAPIALALCAALVVGGSAAGLYASGAVEFKDEEAIYTDSFYRLSTGVPRTNQDEWIYSYMWSDGAYVIQQHPITGTGPDNWSKMYENGLTADRSYNEYLDVGMQRGIICLVLYGLFLIVTLVKLFKAAARHFRDGESVSWTALGFLGAIIAYMVQAFFNIGSNFSSPYFWLVAGVGWSFFASKTKEPKKVKTKAEKAE